MNIRFPSIEKQSSRSTYINVFGGRGLSMPDIIIGIINEEREIRKTLQNELHLHIILYKLKFTWRKIQSVNL